MSGSEHLYELLGFSKPNECNGHVWKGEGRCPYCSDLQLGSKRSSEIIVKALEILEIELERQNNECTR